MKTVLMETLGDPSSPSGILVFLLYFCRGIISTRFKSDLCAPHKALTPFVIVFVGMTFFSTVGRIITKGIVDVEGDKLEGVRTVAVFVVLESHVFGSALLHLDCDFQFFPIVVRKQSIWLVSSFCCSS